MIFAYLFRKINHFVSTGKLIRSFAPGRGKKSAPQAGLSPLSGAPNSTSP